MQIQMPRGDLRSVRLTVSTSAKGRRYEGDFDEIYFTVKESFSSKNYLFQKRLSRGEIAKLEDGSYTFTIQPSDTDSLAIKAYVFDIELVRNNTIKQTTVGDLVLTSEVTFAENEA